MDSELSKAWVAKMKAHPEVPGAIEATVQAYQTTIAEYLTEMSEISLWLRLLVAHLASKHANGPTRSMPHDLLNMQTIYEKTKVDIYRLTTVQQMLSEFMSQTYVKQAEIIEYSIKAINDVGRNPVACSKPTYGCALRINLDGSLGHNWVCEIARHICDESLDLEYIKRFKETWPNILKGIDAIRKDLAYLKQCVKIRDSMLDAICERSKLATSPFERDDQSKQS
jgi:hypothetical protein